MQRLQVTFSLTFLVPGLMLMCFAPGCETDAGNSSNEKLSQANLVELSPTESEPNVQNESATPVSPFLLHQNQDNLRTKTISQFGEISQNSSPMQKNAPIVDHLAQAKLMMNQREWNKAIAELQTVVINVPDQQEALKLLVNCYLQTGEFRKALPYVEKGLKLNPVDGELYYIRGLLYSHSRKFTEALESLLKAESLGYQDESLNLQICASMINLNDIGVAEARAMNMLSQENSAKNGHAELILGFVALQKQDMNTARKYYQLCQEKGNCPPDMLQSLGQILEGK